MAGPQRMKAETLSQDEGKLMCSTLGCIDPAVVVLPVNDSVVQPRSEIQQPQTYYVLATRALAFLPFATRLRKWLYWQDTNLEYQAEVRLCMRCVRSLATALPPGKRLGGARLRYPEIAPKVAAAEFIPGTPEYDKLTELSNAMSAAEGAEAIRSLIRSGLLLEQRDV